MLPVLTAEAGITREGAYKALKPGTKTQLQTALGILDALGMAIQIVPKGEAEGEAEGHPLASQGQV